MHQPSRFKMKLRAPIFLLFLQLLYTASSCTEFTGAAAQPVEKNTASPDQTPTYKVVKIKDGDTFVVLKDNTELTVRFEHIDCPEKNQPFGTKAKQFVSDQCFGKNITLQHHNKYDRNKRLIAEVILENGRNLNKALVENGLAWHFKQYSDDTGYAKLELTARKNQVGLWSEKDPVAPWLWRKK
ncbi:MAG: thermonuclease family protein [Chitinophagaceae bacterium]